MSSDDGLARVSCGLRGFLVLVGWCGLLKAFRWKDAHCEGRRCKKLHISLVPSSTSIKCSVRVADILWMQDMFPESMHHPCDPLLSRIPPTRAAVRAGIQLGYNHPHRHAITQQIQRLRGLCAGFDAKRRRR